MTSASPSQVAHAQLLAYNARDIDAFMACFSDDAMVIDLDTGTTRCENGAAIRAFYDAQFVRWPLQRSRVTNRQELGEFVTDLEYITGVPDREAYFLLAIYRIREGKIDRAWFSPRVTAAIEPSRG